MTEKYPLFIKSLEVSRRSPILHKKSTWVGFYYFFTQKATFVFFFFFFFVIVFFSSLKAF